MPDNGPPPAIAAAAIGGWQRLLARRNDEATLKVVQKFRLAGLDPLVLKGPATRAAMGSPDRPSSDIDLLVAPDEYAAAQRWLKAAGYACRKGVHADTWTAPGRTDIDLHWTLPRLAVGPKRAWAAIQRHRESIPCSSGSVDVLDAGGRLVHLALHATMDDTGRPQDDLVTAAARLSEPEWSQAVGLAHDWGISASVAWALTSVGRPADAARFGESRLDPTMPHERGWLPFLASPVHWYERARRTARIFELWLAWTRGRLVRFATGKARANAVVRSWLQGRRP